jgi:hypothetical protein
MIQFHRKNIMKKTMMSMMNLKTNMMMKKKI